MRSAGVRPGDVVVGISASGRAPYVVGAMAAARGLGAETIALTNHAPADISAGATISIAPLTGPEVLAGSTRLKAGTSQKLVLNMLTTAAFTRLGRVYGNLMVDLRPTNSKLRARAVRIIRQVTDLDDAAAQDLLRRAGGRVKVALVMHLAGVDAADASARLERATGFVRRAVSPGEEA
jgi:N-acetylmuramic acid 6-phosphate etherase